MGKGNAATKGRNAAEDGRRAMVGKRKPAADGKNVTTREKNATVGRRRAVEKERDAAMDERSNATDKRNSTARGKNATVGKGDAIEKGRNAAAGERRVTVGKKRAAVGESNAFPNVLFHFLEKMGVGRGTFSLFYLPLRANTGHSALRKRKQGQTIPYILSKNRHKTA